jgi:hypothetical protein
MAIYDPTPWFSKTDKQLLVLLGKLLLEHVGQGRRSSNLPNPSIALTDSEANHLLALIEQLLSSREFLESTHFVEALTLPGEAEESKSRELFLSNRKRRGRSRILASTHWAEFKARAGLSGLTLVSGHRISPMDLGQFQEMEGRLLQASGAHRDVVELVMKTLRSHLPEVQEIRDRKRSLRHGVLRRILLEPYERWNKGVSSTLDREVSVDQVSAAMLLVADVSVLFTTCDWGVAGTLSAMASSTIALMHP